MALRIQVVWQGHRQELQVTGNDWQYIAASYVGLLDYRKLADGLPAIAALMGETMPPNFTEWRNWIKLLVDTLAMSIAGTALAVAFSLPLAILAARNTSPHHHGHSVRRRRRFRRLACGGGTRLALDRHGRQVLR